MNNTIVKTPIFNDKKYELKGQRSFKVTIMLILLHLTENANIIKPFMAF